MEQCAARHELSDAEIPGILIDRGWRQGTVFCAPGAQFSLVGRDEVGLVSRVRSVAGDGRLVVVSQSCDINAAIDREPVVEAFACAVEPNSAVRASFSKSFRRFEIDPEEGLMAHASDRVAFDKRTLLELTPEPWPGSAERLRRFSRWLGRRASRAAIPPSIVDAFADPLRDVLDSMRRKQKAEFVAFNQAVEEIRISLPESDLPPFEIGLVLLLAGEELGLEAADALDLVEEKLEAKLEPEKARLVGILRVNKSKLSVEAYFSTVLIEVDHLTYAGEEILGAESADRL